MIIDDTSAIYEREKCERWSKWWMYYFIIEREREREDEWASVLWNDELIFFLCIFGMTAIPIIGVGMRDFTCNIVIKTNKKRKSRRGNIFFVFGSCNLYYTLYIFFCNFIFIIFSVFPRFILFFSFGTCSIFQ